MRLPFVSAALVLLAGVLWAPTSSAQVTLTTLPAPQAEAVSGPYRLSARVDAVRPVTSGAVRVWGTFTPVARRAAASEAPVVASAPVAAQAAADGVEEVALGAVAPNPLGGTAQVHYALPDAAPVRLAVYDALGREVAVLADGLRPAGRHQATLDASRLAPGLYIARLTTGTSAHTERFTVVR